MFRILGIVALVFVIAGCSETKTTTDTHTTATATDDSAAGEVAGLWCAEHGVAESECGICHPDLASGLEPGQSLKIRFASSTAATRAGIRTEALGSTSSADVVTAVGEIGYNMNRLARITSPVDGVVKSVKTDVGAAAGAGAVLLSISSPRVSELRGELLRARSEEEVAAQSLRREEDLFAQKVASARELEDARARHQAAVAATDAARQTLRDLGMVDADIEHLVRGEGSQLPLRAPFAGTVVERSVTLGDVVAPGTSMFVIANLDVMWLTLSVSESDMTSMHVGDNVEVHVDAQDRDVEARITWVSSNLDETTRMGRVRAEIANQDRWLRAGMFVTARVNTGDKRSSLHIDRDAVHTIDGHMFVFVRSQVDLFELRCVDVRPAGSGRMALLDGVGPHDQVVTHESYLVKAEMEKSRLGAGCVD